MAAVCASLLVAGAVWLSLPDEQSQSGADTASGRDSEGIADTATETFSQPRHADPGTPEAEEAVGRVFRCYPAEAAGESSESVEEQMERERARYFGLIDGLAASGDFEHELTAGILKANGNLPDAIDDLEKLLVIMPDNPVLHWRLLDACDVRPSHPLCRSGNAETRVIRVLGSNGEAWAKIAHYRIKRGDDAGGLEALYNASSAAQFNDFWSAEVVLLFRALAIDANQTVPKRLSEAIGYVAAFSAPELQLINQCRTRVPHSPDWSRACLSFAERKEADARTTIGKGIGIGLQRAIYIETGQPEKAAAVLAREKPVIEALRDPLVRDGEILISYDESIALGWLQQLSTYGEFAAREYLKAEVERVSQIPGYDPCPQQSAPMQQRPGE